MRFTVVPIPSAEDALGRIWLEAPDRAAVSAASNHIDYLLKHWPITVGVPYEGRLHLVVEPLAVVYEVSPDDCKVTILEFSYVGSDE